MMKLFLIANMVAQTSAKSCVGVNCGDDSVILLKTRNQWGLPDLDWEESQEPPTPPPGPSAEEIAAAEAAAAEAAAAEAAAAEAAAKESEATETFNCVLGVFDTEVDFASSHSVRLNLTMPEDPGDARQWLFSGFVGGDVWLWSPMGNVHYGDIQFGVWDGQQITEYEGSDEADFRQATSLATTYDANTEEYKLYINGHLKKSISGVQFQPTEMKIYVGVLPWVPTEATFDDESRFTGCINSAEIFNRVLSDSEIQTLHEQQFENMPDIEGLSATTMMPEAAETFNSNDSNVCLWGEEATTVDITASHTVHMTVEMPTDPVSNGDVRQWLLQFGPYESGVFGERWLWTPNSGRLQFGGDNIYDEIFSASTLTTVYDADTTNYRFYMNGNLLNAHTLTDQLTAQSQVFIGVLPWIPGDPTALSWGGTQTGFSGCIKRVEIYDEALSDSIVQALT